MGSGSSVLRVKVAPITEDDEWIAAALQVCSVLPLAASIVHLQGDPSVVRGRIRPRRILPNEFDGALDETAQAQLRRHALAAVIAYRDAGSPPPQRLAQSAVDELMDWMAGQHVAEDYAELFREEMDLDGVDPRRLEFDGDASALSVVIVGCGMSGLLAGVRLKQAGIPFEILEKNDDVGGTWLENTYPGCRVDVGNHYYCYSFEPNHGFDHYFSEQAELHGYFGDVMRRHGVDRHVRWGTEVERLEWDERAQRWRVAVRRSDGVVEVITANVVISAVGQLNRPSIPDLPNLERFAGPVFHSAQWDHSVELRGKRVALIGAGASGFQIGPAIAPEAEELIVFQRSAQWMFPNPRYHDAVPPGEQWAMRHLPGYARWYRFLLLWQATDKMLDIARVDPTWPDLPRSANASSARFREMAVAWMASQVGDDPELLAKVVPDYPPLGKRLLQDNGSWLTCLKRDDVELVREPITDIDAGAVVAGGERYEVDLLVMATGFRANDLLFPMEVAGRDGTTLHERWAGRPAAYLGVTVPDFPNFFIMYGPGTNLAHAGSVIFQSECQMRYIGGCLDILVRQGGGTIEPTTAAFDDYVERWQAELATMVWSHPSVKQSWYKAADGHVYLLSPWRLVDYWKMTGPPHPECHEVQRSEGAA